VDKSLCSEEILNLWQEFVKSGRLPTGHLHPVVQASWQRCHDWGVNPHNGHSDNVLEPQELKRVIKEHEQLISIALPLMQQLNQYVVGSGFLVILTDERGFILEILGDPEAMPKAQHLNFIKGANWSEKAVGTNAIGTAIYEGIPVTVSGPEHYCQKNHVLTCSAAPIFDCDRKMIGVLDMSAPSTATHKHTLGMVVSAAEAIMFQMHIYQKNLELSVANERMRNVFMTMSDGLLVFEKDGSIQQINPVAEKLLGRSSEQMKGQALETVFLESSWIRETLRNGQDFIDVETTLRGTTGSVSCVASLKPIKDERGFINGGVIIFNPLKRIRNLVNRFSGAHAIFQFKDIIGNNRQFLDAVQIATLAAEKNSNILLQGESGTGKELFAQAIHSASPRHAGPFVALNCGAIPRELLGSELFGYVEGAFTGARRGGRPGKFELASGGTLFLDEIGEMPLGKQVSLLRAVQEKEITRIGDDKVIPVDVRIICATNKDLKAEVEKGNFREDLYYRLNVIKINLPPLRERREDIPLQFNYFLNELSQKMGLPVPEVEDAVMDYLINYKWPGNVRELQNVVERMINISNGKTITTQHLPVEILQGGRDLPGNADYAEYNLTNLGEARKRKKQAQMQKERESILRLLHQYEGNISRVAQALDVSRNTIYRKMKQYDIR